MGYFRLFVVVLVVGSSGLLSSFSQVNAWSPEVNILGKDDAASNTLVRWLAELEQTEAFEAFTQTLLQNNDDIGDLFPSDPVSRPVFGDNQSTFPFPSLNNRQGAAFLVSMEVLYQTLQFYGVVHYLERTGNRIEFKVIESRSGHFRNLTNVDIAFALREMARYLTAHLCNNPSIENFYQAFIQVPPEEIGLRFKYDMAWALLGNYLPREPNAMFLMGTRWKALDKILNGTRMLNSPDMDARELRNWASFMSDIIGVVGELNKLMCFVDITPVAREELKKRSVVNKLLRMQTRLEDSYANYKNILEEAAVIGRQEQLNRIREPD